jgi:hypothetical protein
MMAGNACRITKKIRDEVASSVRYAESSWTALSGKNRRSAAKAIARAEKLIEKDTQGVWKPEQTKKIHQRILGLMGTLYSGGQPVDDRTIKKAKSLLDDLDHMTRRTC